MTARWRPRTTRRWRAWLAASVLCLIALDALVGCGETAAPRGGLMLVVSTDGPLAIDHLQIEVSAKGQSLLANKYRVPEEVELPTTVAIVSNGDATAQAQISVTGWTAGVPLDRRDAIVTQIPTDRVATLNVVLSARCSGKLTVNADGSAVSSCGEGNTCDNFGSCVTATVPAADLPTYRSGSANDAGLGGSSSVAAVGGSSSAGRSSAGSSAGGRSPTSGVEPEAASGEGGAAGAGGLIGDSGSSGGPLGGTGGAAPPDPCAGIACDGPPAADCISASQFKSYDNPGVCDGGKCSYTSHVIACNCQNHACTTDPCASLTCTDSVCLTGACQGVCAPPQNRCNGVVPQTCTAAGAWHDEPVIADQCGAKCTPGKTQCAGLTALQTCSPSGAWSTALACTNQTCVSSPTGSACTGVCAQGQTKCSNNDVQSCSVTGDWSTAAPCQAPKTCQGAACACPASVPNLCSDNCTNFQTDKFNCGSCGHSCQGGACTAGVCQAVTLFTTTAVPVNIALSSSAVYWTETGSQSVSSLPLSGGSSPSKTALLGAGAVPCAPMGLVVDETNMYAIARHDNCTDLGSVSLMTAPLAGGAATILASGVITKEPWHCVALDSANVYYTDFDNAAVLRVPKSGGSSTWLTPYPSMMGYALGVAVQGGNVYWGSRPSTISRVSSSGGTITSVVSDADGRYLAVDNSYVYYTGASGAVEKTLLTGGSPVTLVPSGAVGALVVDANNVYYLGASTVMMVPKLGGTVTTLASGQTSPVDIAVDATSVYWLTSTTVMKRAL